jgi:hypothetical protein
MAAVPRQSGAPGDDMPCAEDAGPRRPSAAGDNAERSAWQRAGFAIGVTIMTVVGGLVVSILVGVLALVAEAVWSRVF